MVEFQLNNLCIILDNLYIEQEFFYVFNFGGGFIVNGFLINFDDLRVDGIISFD